MKNLRLITMICCILILSNYAEAKNVPHNTPIPEIDIRKALDIADKYAKDVKVGPIEGELYIRDASLVNREPLELHWIITYSDPIKNCFYVFVYMDGRVDHQESL